MKKLVLVLSSLLSLVVLMSFGGGDEFHSTGGAPAGYAGDPSGGNKTCNTSGCHTGATVGTLTGVFSSTIPPAGYTPGATYTITASFVRPGHSKFGFEASPQNTTGTKLGTLANITGGTQLVGPGGKYVTHTSSGVSGTGSRTWNFKWTAPATGLGPVTFYGTFNATNNNGTTAGDSIFRSTLVIAEAPASVSELEENDFSLLVFPNPASDFVHVRFTLTNSSPVEIQLLDVTGKKIASLPSEDYVNGEVNRTLNISSYPEGLYFVRVSSGQNVSLQKILKM